MSEKLQKVLARLGLGSRRQLDSLIAQKRVEVNGKIANVGDRVDDDIIVKIDGKVVATPKTQKPKCRVIMYHKKEGELTTLKDPEDRPTVFDHLPRPDFGRWIYVGRLDLNTSGLLLLTTDGDLANALMHPRGEIERVYAVRVFGQITDEHIQKLQTGVMLEDGMAKFDRIVFAGGEGINRWYHVSLKEGRNREVRRLFEAVDLKVSRLIRIKYANLELDPKLKQGHYRELTLSEINNLRAKVKLKALTSDEIAHEAFDSYLEKNKHNKHRNKFNFDKDKNVSLQGKPQKTKRSYQSQVIVKTDRFKDRALGNDSKHRALDGDNKHRSAKKSFVVISSTQDQTKRRNFKLRHNIVKKHNF